MHAKPTSEGMAVRLGFALGEAEQTTQTTQVEDWGKETKRLERQLALQKAKTDKLQKAQQASFDAGFLAGHKVAQPTKPAKKSAPGTTSHTTPIRTVSPL